MKRAPDVDIYALWEEMGRKVPVLSAVRPNGAVRIEQFEDAGGAGAMLKRLAAAARYFRLTVTGHTLAEVLASTPTGNTEIIRPLGNPISAGPVDRDPEGLAGPGKRGGEARHPRRQPSGVLRWSRGGLRKHQRAPWRTLPPASSRRARVLVLRGQGLKGGPAMGGGASLVLFAIDAAGLARDIAFVTDGQLSGLCLKGLTVAEVAPEGATGGPIGKVRTGDRIVIDIAARRLDLDVPAAELAARPRPPPAVFRSMPRGIWASTGAMCSRWRPVRC